MLFSLAIVFANKGLYTARNILIVLAALSIVFYLIHIIIFVINKPKKVKTKTYQDLFNEMTEFEKNIDIIYPTPIKENKDEDDLIIKTEEEKIQNEKYDDSDSNLATEENLSIEEEEEIKIADAKASARIINPENVTDGFIEYLKNTYKVCIYDPDNFFQIGDWYIGGHEDGICNISIPIEKNDNNETPNMSNRMLTIRKDLGPGDETSIMPNKYVFRLYPREIQKTFGDKYIVDASKFTLTPKDKIINNSVFVDVIDKLLGMVENPILKKN
jgi:hypothetical protein